MRRVIIRTINIILGCLILFQLSGCSIVGYSTGALVDAMGDEETITETDEIIAMKEGKKVSLITKDGQIISGKYSQRMALPDSVYKSNLNKAALGDTIPEFNDSLIFKLTDSQEISNRFYGFGYFIKNSPDKLKYHTSVGQFVPVDCLLDNKKMIGVPLNSILEINSVSGKRYDGHVLRELALEKSLPLNQGLLIMNDSVEALIPLNEIVAVEVGRSNSGRKTGFIYGLAIDVLILAIAVSGGFDMDMDMDFGGSYGY